MNPQYLYTRFGSEDINSDEVPGKVAVWMASADVTEEIYNFIGLSALIPRLALRTCCNLCVGHSSLKHACEQKFPHVVLVTIPRSLQVGHANVAGKPHLSHLFFVTFSTVVEASPPSPFKEESWVKVLVVVVIDMGKNSIMEQLFGKKAMGWMDIMAAIDPRQRLHFLSLWSLLVFVFYSCWGGSPWLCSLR